MFSDIWYSHVYDVPGVPIRQGDVVIDIGANQGFFTCYAAFKSARVLAFEPVPELCQRLRENVDRNGFTSRVTIQQCAIGAAPGLVNLFVSSYLGGAQSTTVPEFMRGAGVPVVQETLVECKTLSQILEEFSLQRIRLCKLDVEGAELAILKTLSHADLARIESLRLSIMMRLTTGTLFFASFWIGERIMSALSRSVLISVISCGLRQVPPC